MPFQCDRTDAGHPPEKEITVNIARTARRARLHLIISALVVAIAALVIPLSQTASANTTTRGCQRRAQAHHRA
jgi:hypothetical protein